MTGPSRSGLLRLCERRDKLRRALSVLNGAYFFKSTIGVFHEMRSSSSFIAVAESSEFCGVGGEAGEP